MDRLTELEVFQRVARLGSFTRAAESLGISRATVTRTIRLLESRLGVTLLSRTTRVVTLSAAGSDFLLEAEELLARCDALYDHFKAASKELTGSLKVAASPAFSAFFVAQALEDFQRLHPKLHLELVTHLDDLTASSLIEHRIDLACCVADTAPESVVAVRLGAAESFVCAAPGALSRWGTPSTPDDIPSEAMIPGKHPDQWILRNGLHRATLVPHGPIVLPDAHLVLQSALRSAGFALLPAVAVRDALRSGQLRRVLPDWQAQTIGIYALLASRIGADQRLTKLIDFLRSRLSDDPSDPS